MRTTARPSLVLAVGLADLPLLALMLTPQLLRSRVEAWPGASAIGITAFVLLPFVVLWLLPSVSAAVQPAPGWTARRARQVVAQFVRRRPRTWARIVGEYLLLILGSQLLGGAVAAVLPHFQRDPDTPGAWLFSYPPYALQAVVMWLVICIAHAWYAARVTAHVLPVDGSQDGAVASRVVHTRT